MSSGGYGKSLLDWLINYAKSEGCQQLALDSGVQRKAAHRFYTDHAGMTMNSYHFSIGF